MTQRFRWFLLAGAAVAACSGSESGRFGMFELRAAHFDQHASFALSSSLAPDRARAQFAAGAWNDTGLTFEKGEVLLIEATGTVKTQSLDSQSMTTIDADGYFGWLGGIVFPLVNRTAGAVYGRIGTSVFAIGKGTALLAPASGSLEVIINICLTCAIDGSFAVAVHRELSDGVELATLPALTDNTVVETVSATVSGHGFQPTGLTVARGDKIYVDATGSVTTGVGRFDANGAAGLLGGTPYLIPSADAGRLHARVAGRIVALGTTAAFLAPADGSLELAVNANMTESLTGSLSVTVQRGIRPAQGLESIDLAAARTATASVSLDDTWVGTGVIVERGSPIVVSATGTLSGPRIAAIEPVSSVDPAGLGSFGGTPFLIPSRPAFGLHLRVGDQVHYTGASSVVLAPASGEVEVAINAIPRCDTCADCSACLPPACDPASCQLDCRYCGDFEGGYQVTIVTP